MPCALQALASAPSLLPEVAEAVVDEPDTPKQAQDAATAIVEPEEPGPEPAGPGEVAPGAKKSPPEDPPEQEVQEKPAAKSIQMISELRHCMRAQVARSHSRY